MTSQKGYKNNNHDFENHEKYHFRCRNYRPKHKQMLEQHFQKKTPKQCAKSNQTQCTVVANNAITAPSFHQQSRIICIIMHIACRVTCSIAVESMAHIRQRKIAKHRCNRTCQHRSTRSDSRHVTSYCITSYHTISYHAISYHITLQHMLSHDQTEIKLQITRNNCKTIQHILIS